MKDEELFVTLIEDVFRELNCSLNAELFFNKEWVFKAYIGVISDIIVYPHLYQQVNVRLNVDKQTIKINDFEEINIADPELLEKLRSNIDLYVTNVTDSTAASHFLT